MKSIVLLARKYGGDLPRVVHDSPKWLRYDDILDRAIEFAIRRVTWQHLIFHPSLVT